MSFRRSARSPRAEAALTMEDRRLIAQGSMILWVIYHGKLANGKIATGYDVKQHKAWCIPRSLWVRRKLMSQEAFDDEAIRSATASACERSNLPLAKARRVNSPGLASLTPLSINSSISFC